MIESGYDHKLISSKFKGYALKQAEIEIKEDMFKNGYGNEYFSNKSPHIMSEDFTNMLVNLLKIRQRDGRLFTLVGGLPIPITVDDVRGFVIINFLKLTTNDLRLKLWNNIISSAPILPPLDENVVSFKNISYKIDTKGHEESNKIGKIRVDQEYEETIAFDPWVELVENHWHNDVKDINRLMCSIFFTKEIITKRRAIFIWDSNGNAGKTYTFVQLQDRMIDDFNWGGITRDYSQGQMGTMKGIELSPINIIDDAIDFTINDGFATDHTKNIFKIKNIGEDSKIVKTWATTVILCNGLTDKVSTDNNRKRFDYIFSDNDREDRTPRMQELFEEINDNIETLINYLFTWYIDNINSILDKEQITYETFNEEDESLKELYNKHKLQYVNENRINKIYELYGIDKNDATSRAYLKEMLHSDPSVIAIKSGSSYKYRINHDVKIIQKPVRDVPKNVEVDSKAKGKMKKAGLISGVEVKGGFSKLILKNNIVVLDIEPIEKDACLDERTKEWLVKFTGAKMWTNTNCGVHLWFRTTMKDKLVTTKMDSLGLIIEIKKTDIFSKDNYNGSLRLTNIEDSFSDYKVLLKSNKPKKASIGLEGIDHMSEEEIKEKINGWNYYNGDTFEKGMQECIDGESQRNNRFFRLYMWLLTAVGIDKSIAQRWLLEVNEQSTRPMSENRMEKTIFRFEKDR